MEAKKKTAAEQEGKNQGKSKEVLMRYAERLRYLKLGQDYSRKGDLPKSVENYLKYLNCVSKFMEVDQAAIHPRLFDDKKDVTEMFLLSQVYWDLAKAYDNNPKLHAQSEKYLSQFVLFSTGFKYQYVNFQMIRKYIRNKAVRNTKAFQSAMDKIRLQSQNCYIASYCYGTYHPHLRVLRHFKITLLKFSLGRLFVDYYYSYCPLLVLKLEKMPIRHQYVRLFLIMPLLEITVMILKIGNVINNLTSTNKKSKKRRF